MKTSGGDLIYNKRNLFVLAVATLVFFAIMAAGTDRYLRAVGGWGAGLACFVWWTAMVWRVGNYLQDHGRIVWLYDIVTSAMPALCVWAFLYDKYKDATIERGSLWGTFLFGLVAGSIVGTVGAIRKGALNSHNSLARTPVPHQKQNNQGE